MSKSLRYYITTWDPETQRFTPQIGVPEGPYSLFGLRTALRKLQDLGYGKNSSRSPCVLIQRRD